MQGPEDRKQVSSRELRTRLLKPLYKAFESSTPVVALAHARENSTHHGGMTEVSVYQHTMRVVGNTKAAVEGRLEVIPTTLPKRVRDSLKTTLRGYFAEDTATINGYPLTRANLQIAYGYTHDIGKGNGGVVERPNKAGHTSSAGHEEKGAKMMDDVFNSPSFSNRGLLLPEALKAKLTFLVQHHGDVSDLIIAAVKQQGLTSTQLEKRADEKFAQTGAADMRDRVAIMLNVIADFESGRDPKDKTGVENETGELGFTKKEKDGAKYLLAYYLGKL